MPHCGYAVAVQGHLWTVWPRLRRGAAAVGLADERWEGSVVDPQRGVVPLRGWLRHAVDGRTLVGLVHGLGGSSQSPYLTATAAACQQVGAATLRLGLRGSDGDAPDFYHAGLTADVAAALAAPELAGYERVVLLGFSLGGHVVLRYATEEPDRRLAGVAAVCSPLDLRLAQRSFDRPAPSAWPYRAYILGRLKRVYASIAALGPVPTPVERVQRARTLREWDALTVVPRFGFASPEDYYATMSVGPRLRRLTAPALLVAGASDPMVPAASIAAAAAAAGGVLDLRWARRGGHVGFPASLDLGIEAPPGLPAQLAGWVTRAAAGEFPPARLSEIPETAPAAPAAS
jgi:predicted alpha/beta-fold hydrolase